MPAPRSTHSALSAGLLGGLLASLLAACAPLPPRESASPQWQQIGSSVEGRPLQLLRVGTGPRKVLWIGGIHGDEREGRCSVDELPRLLQEHPDASQRVTLLLLADLNPDGTAARRRSNARGVDLNRNYPAANFQPGRFHGRAPLDQPEARCLHDLILRERPDLVVVMHSWRGDHFINFDGPGRALAQRYHELSGYRLQDSTGIAPTPGSLGSWVGGSLGIPILTVEYERGRDPWAVWEETAAASLAVVLGEELDE